jgi:CheY-like chemotaxis protein
MMAEGTLGADDQQRIAGLVRRSANAQARLIEDLMDLTRITRGKVRLELAPTDVHALVKETLEVFGPEIDAKGIEVAVHLDAEDRVVNGDAGRLRQVFSNLIRNACKFTPSGGQIAVRSWNHQQRLLVEVADTGMGLEAAQIERLFVPFEQASSGAGGGVGLGLAIVKGIVDLHGGRIGASSPGRDKGSRFVVDLGAVASADLSTRRTMELPTIGERKAPSRSREPARHILLVEDNPDIAESLAIALEAEGYQVARAPTVKAALDADLDEVALVLSDVQLPDGRGPELLRRLRRRRDVPAIALSGYGTHSDVAACLAAGFSAHFSKPFDLQALLRAVRSATEATGMVGSGVLVRTHGHGRA